MMKRPAELIQLLDELKGEAPESAVVVQADSRLVVVIDDTEVRYEFTGPEAKLLLASRDTVERLFEALDYPEETFVELQNLTIDEDVMAELESYASTVDEM
jgi:hypothetical protein